MLFPASADFMLMPPDEFESRIQSPISEAVVLRQIDFRLKPKLRFPLNVMHMYVRTRFLPREEEKPKSFLAEDCRAHDDIIHPSTDFGGDRSFQPWSASKLRDSRSA
jgi:hypothetical protein